MSVEFKPGITQAQAMAVLEKYDISASSSNFKSFGTSSPGFAFTVAGSQSFQSILSQLKTEPTVYSVQ